MRACRNNPEHPIAEDADPRRVFCSGACKQADYRRRLHNDAHALRALLAARR